MNQLVPSSGFLVPALPALVTAAGDRVGMYFLEFFTAQIRNPHTRRAMRGRLASSCPGARVWA
jgi:hypothetical protein